MIDLETIETLFIPEPMSGCWLWIGGRSSAGTGYGYYKRVPAHRVVYESVTRVPIDPGLELDHLCRNTMCVNPAHVEPVTHQVNIRLGVGPFSDRARQTHCVHGHEFTEVNILRRRGRKTRACRQCHYDRMRIYNRVRRARHKEALDIKGQATVN